MGQHNACELPNWFLRARISPPRRSQRIVPRRRVVATMGEAISGEVLWVSGPPGYGKSLALTEWFYTQCEQGIRAAWFTVDSTDNPATIVAYLRMACWLNGLTFPENSPPITSAIGTTPSLEVQSLLASIERMESPWLLVLDDIDNAPGDALREVIGPLLRFFPGNLTLAMASRNADVLDLHALRQRGLLRRIGPDTLRFNLEEIGGLLGRSATPAQVRTVEQKTGGWPALVHMMLEHGFHLDAAALGTASSERIRTFFEKLLLARLEPSLRAGLLRLSLLDRFNSTVAEAILGDDVSGVLAHLDSLGILNRGSYEGVELFSVHPLLRGYMSELFAREEPAAARDLHRRAALSYLACGDFVQAAGQASATQDHEFLADVIETMNPLLLGIREGFSRLRQIVRFIPPDLAQSRPRLGYACVASHTKAGRLRMAKELFEKIDGAFASSAIAPEPSTVLFERALSKFLLVMYKGISIEERDIVALDSLVATAPSLTPMALSISQSTRSFIQRQQSRFAMAEASARNALACSVEADLPYLSFYSYCDLGMIAGVQGRVAEALELFDESISTCASPVRQDDRLRFIADAFRIELEHELNPNAMGEAARLKNLCVRLPNLESWLEVYGAAYRTYSEKLYLAGDVSAALTILAVGLDYLREQEIEGVPTVLVAQKVMLLAHAGRIGEARAEVVELQRELLDDSRPRSWREAEAVTEAYTMLDIAAGERESVDRLTDSIRHCESNGNVRSEIRLRRLRHALGLRLADTELGTGDLERLERLEAETGFERGKLFASHAAPLGAGTDDVGATTSDAPGYFTPREQEVLSALERGLSDKGIAADLGITAHGVRYHLKRIYAKLGASDRLDALEKARRLRQDHY